MDWHFLQFTVGREWVWGLLLNGFCVHLARPLVLLAVFAIVFAGVGRGVGLPALFLPKRWFPRFAIGAGLGVLMWQAVLAGYLFEELATNYTIDRPPFCEVQPDTGDQLLSYDTAGYRDTLNPPRPQYAGYYDEYKYRYPPASVWSVLRYGGALALAVVAVGVVLFAFWIVRRVFTFLTRTAKPEHSETPPFGLLTYLRVRSWVLVGMVAGLATAVLGASLFLPGQVVHATDLTPEKKTDPDIPVVPMSLSERAAFVTGRAVVELGGWGNAGARSQLLDEEIDDRVAGVESSDVNARRLTRQEALDERRYALEPYYPVYGLFFFGFAAVLAWNAFLLATNRLFSPAAGILLLAHLAVGSQTFIDYFFPTPQLLQFLLLGLIVLCARRYKMRFAALAEHYRAPVSLADHYAEVRKEPLAPTPPPPTVEEFAPLRTEQLTSWNVGPKKPLVMLCVSGGGSRAAAWTVRVLTELEKRIPAFPYHIRMISGASGGIFGAAYYTASLPPPGVRRRPPVKPQTPLPTPRTGEYPNLRELNRSVRRDFLSPVVRALVQNDLARQFQPFQYGADRGAALETAWSDCLGGWLDQSFADLWQGERDGWRPSLVFSPMLVEDGRQLVISNLGLRRVMQNLGRTPGTPDADDLLSREGLEFFKLFPNSKAIPLSTAARMSATFPYIFPAVPLPTEPRRRVVDAGYYDNYGVCLAASWLFTHVKWLKERVSKVAVVHIRDGVSTHERQMIRPTVDDSTAFGLATEGLTTPPAGLWSMRSATNTFRNDNLLHLLNLFFLDHGVPFATAAFEFPGGDDVSLNFTLPEEEAKLIDSVRCGIRHQGIRTNLDELVRWWG